MTASSSAKKRLRHVPERRLGLLYGDLGLSARQTAHLLDRTVAETTAGIRAANLRCGAASHVGWNVGTYREFIARIGLRAADVGDVPPKRAWFAIRSILRRELPPYIEQSGWDRLDDFLREIPYKIEAASRRVTVERLRLLYGDLGFDMATIARMLDAPFLAVRIAVMHGEVERFSARFDVIDHIADLAHYLGLAEWPHYSPNRNRYDRAWSAVRPDARREIERLAVAGKIDWSAVDRFIADRLDPVA